MFASQISQQTYKYVIVLDFQATCWTGEPPAEYRNAEIIEFPAVLYNIKTATVEAEFQQYLKPTEKPKLSDYCLKITGITQKTVDNGISLQKCLIMFEEWLRKELKARNLQLPKTAQNNELGNCAFLTWGDCDLGILLHHECARKDIKKPTYFNQWIDIKKIFGQFHQDRLSKSKYAPLFVLMPKEHSGLDGTRDLSTLTRKMVEGGVTLKIAHDLSPSTWNLNYF